LKLNGRRNPRSPVHKVLLIPRVSIADQSDHGAKLERAEVDNADAEAVAWVACDLINSIIDQPPSAT